MMTDIPPIEALLSHREPMLLLKEVTAFTGGDVSCAALPEALAWYANDEGAMPAWIGIELMAQAVAAHVALLSVSKGCPPRPGALLGTRNFQCTASQFASGAALTVRAREVHRSADGLGSYECDIESGDGKRLAAATLTVYEPVDFKQFILGKHE